MFTDIVLLITAVICIFTDITKRKIYNLVLFPAVILAIGYHIYANGLTGGYFSLKGLSLGLALLFIPYSMGGIGAGDVKLLAAIGALKGPFFTFNTFLAGAIAGGILAIFFLVKRKKLIVTLKRIFLPQFVSYGFLQNHPSDFDEVDKNNTIPYGAAIAIGAATAYFVR